MLINKVFWNQKYKVTKLDSIVFRYHQQLVFFYRITKWCYLIEETKWSDIHWRKWISMICKIGSNRERRRKRKRRNWWLRKKNLRVYWIITISRWSMMRRPNYFPSFLEIWKNIMRYSNSSPKQSSNCHHLSRCMNSWNSSKYHRCSLMKGTKGINKTIWGIWSSSLLFIWTSKNKKYKRWRPKIDSKVVKKSMLGLKKYSKSKSIFNLLDKVVYHLLRSRILIDLKESMFRILESWMEVEKKKSTKFIGIKENSMKINIRNWFKMMLMKIWLIFRLIYRKSKICWKII